MQPAEAFDRPAAAPSRRRAGYFLGVANPAALVTLALGLSLTAASAADTGKDAASEVILLGQLVLLLLVGRLLGEAMVRIGQPSVMGLSSQEW